MPKRFLTSERIEVYGEREDFHGPFIIEEGEDEFTPIFVKGPSVMDDLKTEKTLLDAKAAVMSKGWGTPEIMTRNEFNSLCDMFG